MGTSEFAAPSLRALNERHEIAAVVTRPDSCRGRGLRLTQSPVKTAARGLGLPVLNPEHLEAPAFLSSLRDACADLFFVAAFRVLPRAVFTVPPLGTVNLHGSLLPDYRGAAPIQRAVVNGDSETGLTTFFIEEAVDTGDIILADLTQYLLIEKGGVHAATIIHVQFLTDETAFRFVLRANGEPLPNSSVTPYKGSNTISPFVTLAAR